MPKTVTDMMKTLHLMMDARSTTQRREVYERLRQKVSEDIVSIMQEAGLHYEDVAAKMKVSKKEVKSIIWGRDLKLSELSRLLWELDAEMYPLIRVRKGKKNVSKDNTLV